MNRRNLFKNLAVASAAAALPIQNILAKSAVPKVEGLGTVKITDIKTILTAPNGIKLVVVKGCISL